MITSAAARWLESVGYAAVHAIHVDQRILVGGYIITFWQALSEYPDQDVSTHEIAEILARLHQLTAPETLHLPPPAPLPTPPSESTPTLG